MTTAVRFRAECPVSTWDETFEINAALFDIDGRLLTYLTSEDPQENDKAKVHREDNYASNSRYRSIDIDLIATTFRANPKVAMIVLGMAVATTANLGDFEVRGHGTVKLTVTSNKDSVEVFDFPLGYSQTCNAQILGSLVQDMSQPKMHSEGSVLILAKKKPEMLQMDVLSRWRLKFTSNTLHGTVADLVQPAEAEFRISQPLIEHNDLAGCLPLSTLFKSRRDLINRISAVPLENEKRETQKELQATGGNPLLAPDGSLQLPLDKLSGDLRKVWDRQNMQDQNMQDMWTVVNAIKSEVEIYGNEMKIVDHLAQRMESFENVMLDMFYGTTNLVKNIREAMALVDGQDLSEETIRGLQRERFGTLFSMTNEMLDNDAKEAIEVMGEVQNFRKAATQMEKSMRRSDLYTRPTVRTQGNRLQRLLDTVSSRPSPHSLATGIGRTLLAVDRPESTHPDGLPASYTLAYDV